MPPLKPITYVLLWNANIFPHIVTGDLLILRSHWPKRYDKVVLMSAHCGYVIYLQQYLEIHKQTIKLIFSCFPFYKHKFTTVICEVWSYESNIEGKCGNHGNSTPMSMEHTRLWKEKNDGRFQYFCCGMNCLRNSTLFVFSNAFDSKQ